MADLRVTIAGVEFKNPVIMASGIFGYGREYEKMYSLSRLGGISCWQDAAEMLIAGAKAVQIGSILFSNPYAPLNIIDGLTNYLERENIDSIEKLCASGELMSC